MLVTSVFSFFHRVFYFIKARNRHFRNVYFVVCKMLSVWSSPKKLSFGKELNTIKSDSQLTLSSIYTHFNELKEKALEKHCGRR